MPLDRPPPGRRCLTEQDKRRDHTAAVPSAAPTTKQRKPAPPSNAEQRGTEQRSLERQAGVGPAGRRRGRQAGRHRLGAKVQHGCVRLEEALQQAPAGRHHGPRVRREAVGGHVGPRRRRWRPLGWTKTTCRRAEDVPCATRDVTGPRRDGACVIVIAGRARCARTCEAEACCTGRSTARRPLNASPETDALRSRQPPSPRGRLVHLSAWRSRYGRVLGGGWRTEGRSPTKAASPARSAPPQCTLARMNERAAASNRYSHAERQHTDQPLCSP